MKLSTRARYSLRLMVEIARLTQKGAAINLSQIEQVTSISKRYLGQLAIPLKNASLLRGFSGTKGGYLLARPAAEIRVSQIFEAAIGPVNIADCVAHPGLCAKADWCECRWLYQKLNHSIVEVLNGISLADLLEQSVILYQLQQEAKKTSPCLQPLRSG